MSGQHLLWTLLTLPVHTAPCSSCPLHQSDFCHGNHFSWDCSIGLLQVCESNCHILLSFQFLLNSLPQGKIPSVVPLPSQNQAVLHRFPYTTALILPSTILSRNFNIWLSNVVPLFSWIMHISLSFLYSDYQPHSSILCELPLSLRCSAIFLSVIFQLAQPPPASLLALHQCLFIFPTRPTQ